MNSTKIQVIDLPTAKTFRDAFGFYDDGKTVYNSKPRIFKENGYTFTSTKDILDELQKFGVSTDLTTKEAQVVLENWYNDLLKQQGSNETPVQEYVSNTTLTPDQIASFDKDIERQKKSEEIRASQKIETDRFEKRGKEMFDQQQKNKGQQKASAETLKSRVDEINKEQQRVQIEIATAEAVQEKFKDKVVYAKVIIPETVHLDAQEQKDLEMLREYARADGVIKTRLIDDLAAKIEEKIAPSLENISEEQKILIARTEAVKIVEALAKPEVVINENISTAILNTIHQDKKAVEVISKVLNKDDKLIIAAKNGAMLVALADRNQKVSTEILIENLFGPKLSAAIIGPKNIEVTLSEVKIEEPTTYQVNLYDLNKENISQLHHQESILNTIKEYGQKYGYDKISGVFTNYARTYLKEKIVAMPAGSIIKKAYSSPITQSILAKYGLANPVVWEAAGQSGQFVGFLMKVAPDTAGPLLGFAGKVLGREFVKPVIAKATGQVVGEVVAGKVAGKVATDVGVKAATEIVVGTAAKTGIAASLSATLSATFGSLAPIIGHAIGAVVGWIGGELLSKLKTWWTKNKNTIKPILAVGATIAAIRFLGVGPGLGVGAVATFGLMGTAGLATIATGAFGVLGFIGRSVGIAIATPVIVTLLVIPPLVAFIMLVINNSAYVVPPGPLYDISGNPGGGGIQFECTDEKGPVGIDGPNSPSLIANRAWKITYDLYQGFWCFWNRSPKAPTQYFPNDILTYPDGYPELFDYEAFLSNPNNTPSSGNLFWCTYLVVKSYQDSGVDVPFELNSQTLFDKWPREKILPNEATPNNGVQGTVILFQLNSPRQPTRLNHVGIVYSVDQGGIVFVESNAGVKSQSAAFVSGKISRNIGNMEIKGFGLPN